MTALVDMQGPEARPQSWVRALAVACAFLLAAGVVGLFTVDEERAEGSEADVAAVLTAADKTVAATSARFTTAVAVESADIGQGLPLLEFSGHQDFATGRGWATMTIMGAELELRATERTAYVKASSEAPTMRLKPGTWYAIDVDKVPADESPFAAVMGPTLGNPDPTAVFSVLRRQGVVEKATQEGFEMVGGERTTVYRLTLDADEYQQTVARASPSASFGSIEGVFMDLFVTDSGLVRRHVLETRIRVGGERASATVTTDFSDFGAPVVVEEPPAGQVVRIGSWEEFQRLAGAGR